MLGFRIDPPGPFWLEDLGYFLIDETRRLPARARLAWSRLAALVAHQAPLELLFARLPARPRPAPQKAVVAPLDAPEAWALATEPVVAADAGMHAATALHQAAAEQLDALTYVLEGLRREVRPLMRHARFADDPLPQLPTQQDLEASIEALLELSRRNAATRPKDRARVVA